MKTRILKTNFLAGILMLVWVVFGSSCSNSDQAPKPDTGSEGSKETEVVFSLRTPGSSRQSTRSLDEGDENIVNSVEVLIFSNNGKFVKQADAEKVTSGSGENDEHYKQDFTVVLPTGTYNLVFLANSGAAISESFASTEGLIPAGMLRSEVESKLKASSSRWNVVAGSDGYSDIPMFGEIALAEIKSGVKLNNGKPVRMARMLVKIDVRVTDEAREIFKLRDICLYNYNSSGYVLPNTSASYWDGDRALRATLAGLTTTAGPLVYDGLNSSLSDWSCMNDIYTFEAPAGVGISPDHRSNPCLVVGGYYGVGNTDKLSYYRIDFANKEKDTGDISYFELLRNYWYTVNITHIAAPGYDTFDEALKSGPVNILTDIYAYDEGDLNDTESNGRYQISVDESELLFYRGGGNHYVEVYSDYYDGWEIRDEDIPSWLTITPQRGESGRRTAITVTSDAGGEERGEFYITAGTLRKSISVTRLDEVSVSISVTPRQLTFRATATEKTVTVTLYPGNTMLFSSSTGDIVWAKSPDLLNESWIDGVTEEFSLQPSPNTTGELLSSTVDVFVFDGGRMVKETFTVRQLATDLLFEVETENPYPSSAGTYSFGVQSETPWRIVRDDVGDPDNMVTLLTDEEQSAPPSGYIAPYLFQLSKNSGYVSRTATLRAVSSHEDFVDTDIEITQEGTPAYFYPLDSDGKMVSRLVFDIEAERAQGSYSPYDLNFLTNASHWKYTADDNYKYVVETMSHPPGTYTGPNAASDASDDKELILTLVPLLEASTGALAGTPASGTKIETLLKFETAIPGVPSMFSEVLVKYIIPTRYLRGSDDGMVAKYSPVGGTKLAQSGGTITATATHNAGWKVEAGVNDYGSDYITPATATATAYGVKTLKVTVPAYDGWDSRYFSLTAFIFRSGGYAYFDSPTYFSQQGYEVTWGTPSPTSVGGNANNTVTANPTWTGNAYPSAGVRTRFTTTSSGSTTASGTVTGTGSRGMSIVAKPDVSCTDRTLYLQYEKGYGTGTWLYTGKTITQTGLTFTITSPSSLTAAGGTVSTTVSGGVPKSFYMRLATASTGGTALSPSTYSSSTSRPLVAEMNLATGSRTVYVQYSENGSTWSSAAVNRTQTGGGYTINNANNTLGYKKNEIDAFGVFSQELEDQVIVTSFPVGTTLFLQWHTNTSSTISNSGGNVWSKIGNSTTMWFSRNVKAISFTSASKNSTHMPPNYSTSSRTMYLMASVDDADSNWVYTGVSLPQQGLVDIGQDFLLVDRDYFGGYYYSKEALVAVKEPSDPCSFHTPNPVSSANMPFRSPTAEEWGVIRKYYLGSSTSGGFMLRPDHKYYVMKGRNSNYLTSLQVYNMSAGLSQSHSVVGQDNRIYVRCIIDKKNIP